MSRKEGKKSSDLAIAIFKGGQNDSVNGYGISPLLSSINQSASLNTCCMQSTSCAGLNVNMVEENV